MSSSASNHEWIRYQGPVTSADYNRAMNQHWNHLSHLYEMQNHLKSNQLFIERIVMHENAQLQQQCLKQQSAIEDLQQQLLSLEAGASNVEHVRFAYPFQMVETTTGSSQERAATISAMMQQVTLPIKRSTSKLFVRSLETGKPFFSSAFQMEMHRSQSMGIVKQNDLQHAVDESPIPWFCEISYTSQGNIRSESLWIDVELPGKLLNNVLVNHIQIEAMTGVKVTGISYWHENGWQQIPFFDQAMPLYGWEGPQSYYFPLMPMKKIRIYLLQEEPLMDSSGVHFYFGIRSLKVEEVEFESKGTVWIPFEMSGMYAIEDVEFVRMNGDSVYYREINPAYSWVDASFYEQIQSLFIELQPDQLQDMTASKIWIKATLQADEKGQTPAFHQAKLIYTRS